MITEKVENRKKIYEKQIAENSSLLTGSTLITVPVFDTMRTITTMHIRRLGYRKTF